MKPTLLLIGAAALLLGTTVVAQEPTGDVDSHIAAARAAAGLDFRNTFINLCLGSTPPGGGRGVIAGAEAAGVRPEDVRLLLVTHGHLDHYGAAPEVEAPDVHGERDGRHHRDEADRDDDRDGAFLVAASVPRRSSSTGHR